MSHYHADRWCTKCFSVGHVQHQCPNGYTCVWCGGSHKVKDCPEKVLHAKDSAAKRRDAKRQVAMLNDLLQKYAQQQNGMPPPPIRMPTPMQVMGSPMMHMALVPPPIHMPPPIRMPPPPPPSSTYQQGPIFYVPPFKKSLEKDDPFADLLKPPPPPPPPREQPYDSSTA